MLQPGPVFQALVNDVLHDFLNHFVFVYLDDILVFSPDLDTHRRQVRLVIERLLQHHLYVKAEKCDFHASTVSFLGSIILEGNICMDPEKVMVVRDWPTPSTHEQLQQFLGFANFYRKFIRNFSSVASPFHILTSSKARFAWSRQAEEAIQTLKEKFTLAPVLILPDPKLQFVVEVDASVGVRAVISQRSVSDGCPHPCAFLSRKLNPAEQHYDIGNRELR